MKDEKWNTHIISCLKKKSLVFSIFKEQEALILLEKRLGRSYFYLTYIFRYIKQQTF